jgi:hypothetical protein
MIPRIKLLGLLCALLALQAIAASAAHAVPSYTASAYPATGTGQASLGDKTFTTEAGTIQCDNHGQSPLAAASSTITITPIYTNCKAFGFLNPTINMESCNYVSHATEKVSAGVYKHHVDISCAVGKSIKITAGTCKLELKPQNGLTTIQTTNLAGGTVTVQPNITGIAINVTQDGFGCPFSGTGAKTASYHGDSVTSRVGGGSISVSGE